jgi:hypothetical protein
MSRPKAYLVLAILLSLAFSLNVSAQDDKAISENVSLDNETFEKISYTFVQEAANGTFVKNADGNYTLTLLNTVPYTLYFSDRPEQIAGFSPIERFIAGYNWRSPNAALSLVDADENEDTVILAISKPLYDNKTRTLTYTAKILEDLVNDRFSYHISRADAGIPEKFGRATLIIDDCANGHVYCCKEGDTSCCTFWLGSCAKISTGCCFDPSMNFCQPCHSDSYYNKRCREEGGKNCKKGTCHTCGF